MLRRGATRCERPTEPRVGGRRSPGRSFDAGAGVRAVEAPRVAMQRGTVGAAGLRAAKRGGKVRPDRRITSTIAREGERVARAARVQRRRTEVRLMLRSLARELQRAARAFTMNETQLPRRSATTQLAGSHGAMNVRPRCLASRSSCHGGSAGSALAIAIFFSRCSRCKRDDGARAGGAYSYCASASASHVPS